MRDIPYAITKMNFSEHHEFQKECKRLCKKYKSIHDDIQEFKNVITVEPLGNSKHFNVIIHEGVIAIAKSRLFCRYLKGSSLRIMYAYNSVSCSVDFIELYFKGDKVNEDRARIREYLKSL